MPDALIEIYQADADGIDARPPFTGVGRLPTSEDGTCVFDTIIPGAVTHQGAPPGSAHQHLSFGARLVAGCTRMYFSGRALNASDTVLALVPPARRESLIATPASNEQGLWEFTIRLQADAETVFFDL